MKHHPDPSPPASVTDRVNRLNRIPQFHFDHGNMWSGQWQLRDDCLAVLDALEEAYLPYEGKPADTALPRLCPIIQPK